MSCVEGGCIMIIRSCSRIIILCTCSLWRSDIINFKASAASAQNAA